MSREGLPDGRSTSEGKAPLTATGADAVGQKKTIRARAFDEFQELLALAAYWIFFLAAFEAYGALITGEALGSNVYFRFGWSVVTGLLIAKMILIGDWLKLGERHHAATTIPPTVRQVAIYGPFVFALLLLEKVIEGFFHGQTARDTAERLASMGWKEIAAHTLVIVVAMLPFFALREVTRMTGYRTAREVLRGRGKAATPRD